MKRNRILGALIGILAFSGALAQTAPTPTAGTNWTMVRTATAPGGTSMVSDIVYYNGLGLPIQSVSVKNTPQGADLVLPIKYDGVLRDDAQSYLPYAATGTGGAFRSDAFSAQAQYYQSAFGAEGARPYSVKEYEASPLNRVLRSAGPGVLTTDGSIKYVTYSYESNGSSEVLKLMVDESTNALTISGYYAAGTLFWVNSVDEDIHRSFICTNQEGQTLLTRTYDESGGSVDTYNVYDNAGRVRWVISPEGAARLGTSGTLLPTDARAKEYCYIYNYDERGNVIEKRLPGREPEYMVYDPADRVVMSQDGNQRADGNRWLLIRYDAHDRVISQQTLANNSTREQLTAVFASGQSSTLYDSVAAQLESRYVYDPSQIDSSVPFAAVSGFDRFIWEDSSNRLVYEEVRVLDGTSANQFEKRGYYYDRKGRVVQRVTKPASGAVGRLSHQYDFRGNVLARVESSGIGSDCLTQNYTYDSRGRLLSEVSNLNGISEGGAMYLYDEQGRLSRRGYGTPAREVNNEQLKYTIQGWLKSCLGFEFSLELSYSFPTMPGAVPSYTGNISEYLWRSEVRMGSVYTFFYDRLSRLRGTQQYHFDGTVRDYAIEKNLIYDRNGNIKRLQRNLAGVLSDNFTYTYTGNRLTTLSGSSTGTYTYDANGNTLHDGLHNLDLTYNRLNLTEKVSQNSTTFADYVYLSDGTKLSATNAAGDGLYYHGSFTYKQVNGSLALESVPFGEGRFVPVINGFEVNYFLRDHLGSVRVVINEDGSALERNDYYSFGMRSDGGHLSSNLHRYNGKEEQGFLNLPYLDYGARMYDPRRGGWLTSDPLLENHPEHGPYVFCGDNPIRFVDMNGMDYFRSESGATVWRDQSCMAIAINDEVFRNIGTTLSMQQVDGSYINYYQGVEVSFSEAPSNAELEILNQPSMMGLLLRNNSPLTPKSQHGLMIAGIHNAQGDFFLTGADIIGTGLEMAGNGLAVIGYGVSATGVGAGTGTIMSGTGNILSFIGGGIRLGVNLKKGNYGQAVIGLVGMGLNFGTGYMAKFGSAGRENIEGGVNLFFSPMNSMVGNVNNNTKR